MTIIPFSTIGIAPTILILVHSNMQTHTVTPSLPLFLLYFLLNFIPFFFLFLRAKGRKEGGGLGKDLSSV